MLREILEAKAKLFKVVVNRKGRDTEYVDTIDGFISQVFGYTLEVGQSWQHEKGNKKINRSPKGIKSLVKNLYNAKNNAARNGYGGVSYSQGTVTPEDREKWEAENA